MNNFCFVFHLFLAENHSKKFGSNKFRLNSTRAFFKLRYSGASTLIMDPVYGYTFNSICQLEELTLENLNAMGFSDMRLNKTREGKTFLVLHAGN
jgi:hypothetical protein